MALSVSDQFHEIDKKFVEEELGRATAEQIMTDLETPVFLEKGDLEKDYLSIKQVADRANVRCMDVVQVARYYKIDPVTLEPTA